MAEARTFCEVCTIAGNAGARWSKTQNDRLRAFFRTIYLPIYLSIYRSIYLFICLSIYRSIYPPSIYLPCLSIHLSIYLSIYLSIFNCIHLSIQSILLFYLFLYICPSNLFFCLPRSSTVLAETETRGTLLRLAVLITRILAVLAPKP